MFEKVMGILIIILCVLMVFFVTSFAIMMFIELEEWRHHQKEIAKKENSND